MHVKAIIKKILKSLPDMRGYNSAYYIQVDGKCLKLCYFAK